jgi:hypothetical protein
MTSRPPPVRDRFHGRVHHAAPQRCQWAGCAADGEFKAPKPGAAEAADYQWLCLEHVRLFNEAYDYFRGLTPEEVLAAQSGHPSWDRKTWPFASNGGGFGRASDLHIHDPMEILTGQPRLKRFTEKPQTRGGVMLTAKDKAALKTLELTAEATPRHIKQRYKALVRTYHPDSNGGDRSREALLHKVVEAYTHLAKSPAFST